jgi:hypothetical protein
MNNCISCNKENTNKKSKYCSLKCKNKLFYTKKRNAFKENTGFSYQSFKGLKKKLEIFKERGNGCKICGYNKNLAALEFHHLEPKDKLFILDMRNLSNLSNLLIEKELAKCELICSNCHSEIHNPLLNIESLKNKILN